MASHMIFKYRVRLEHLLHTLMFNVLLWAFYFVNIMEMIVGLGKKLPLKF